MIQRIQSIYLLLAGIIPAFTFMMPMARFYPAAGEGYYTLYGAAFHTVGLDAYAGAPSRPWGMMLLAAVMILITLCTIFCYKNRRKQIRLAGVAIISGIFYYVLYGSYCYAFAVNGGASYTFQVGALLPLLSMLLTWQARRCIRRDEELVRAADRIR